jgi:c(7)-type cytochrome triheme protein
MATPGHRATVSVPRTCVLVLVLGLATGASVAGCSHETRHRVLAFLFEDIPPTDEPVSPAPVIRSPRHPLPPTPTPTPPAVDDAPNSRLVLNTWEDVLRLLPKDRAGNPDWGAALQEQVIAPRPGILPEAVEQESLALDVEIIPKSDAAFTVIFSHRKHGAWVACSSCHTGMFEMKAGATSMKPQEVHTTRYCGACHGTVAFDIVTGCHLCHLQNLPQDLNGRVDWNSALADKRIAPRPGLSTTADEQPVLDLDVLMAPKDQPTFNAIFSHRAHTQWLACANCHPDRFPMEARELSPNTADLHSRQYCGACHGTVSFGIISTCGPCHPALTKARQHQEVLDLDVPIAAKTAESSPTTFSHRTHRWVECPSCHSNLFDTTGGAAKMTAADLYGGKYCAVCHGKVAYDLITRCERCHPAGEAS